MRYSIAFVLLISILSIGILTEIHFPLTLKIGLIFSIFLTAFLWENSILNRNHDSEFKIRSQKKVFGIMDFTNLVVFTSLFMLNIDSEYLLILMLLSWAIPVAEILMISKYEKFKPYTLFVNDNILILNKRMTSKRNLSELTQIRFNNFRKRLELNFISQVEITINIKEYKRDDLERLVGILINKSEHTVSIPDDYEQKIKNCC